jgi:hypothetical protein
MIIAIIFQQQKKLKNHRTLVMIGEYENNLRKLPSSLFVDIIAVFINLFSFFFYTLGNY